MLRLLRFALVLFAAAAVTTPTILADDGDDGLTLCTMTFDFQSWSIIYATGTGNGTITCDNGQTAKVKLSSKGGGLTAGKSKVRDATGRFTKVGDISELFGSYAAASAGAGAGQSAAAAVVTKGEISLTLVGTGTGVELGFSGSKMTIERVEEGSEGETG